MKLLILVAIASVLCLGAGGTAALGSAQHCITSSGATVTVSYTATSGRFLVVGANAIGASVTSILISDGVNTYTLDKFQKSVDTIHERGALSHSANITGGVLTITATANVSSAGMCITVAEYSSGVTGPVDGTPVSSAAQTASLNSGDVTTAHANDLLVAFGFSSNGSSLLPWPQWGIAQFGGTAAGSGAFVLADQVAQAAGTYSATITETGTGRMGAILAAYQCSSCAPAISQAVPHATSPVSVAGGYWASSLNVVSVAKNSLATCGANQFIGWIDSSLVINITKRVLSTSVMTNYNTGIALSDGNEHKVVALACDKNGFIWLAYDMFITPVILRRSTNAGDPSAFNAPLSPVINATDEALATYPMFMNKPSDNDLCFTFQAQAPVINSQYLYCYNADTTTWSRATGSDATNPGLVFMGDAGQNQTFYLNGIPKWDPSGNLWFSATLRTNSCDGRDQYLLEWTGTAFKKLDGSAQTIPATASNQTAVLTTTCPTQIQDDFSIDSAGTIFVGYVMPDGSSNLQEYVAETHTSSTTLTAHQLTINSTPTTTTNTIPPPYSTNFSIGTTTWTCYPDAFSAYKGLVCWRSNDNYATSTKIYVTDDYNPNMTLNYDPALLSTTKRLSFLFQNTNDITYGAQYVDSGTPGIGQITINDWFPLATSLRAVIRGKATVR